MKRFIFAIALSAVTLLSACKTGEYALSAAQVTAAITQLNASMDTVTASVNDNIAAFSADEQVKLKALMTELQSLKRAGQAMLDSNESSVGKIFVNADQLRTLFTQGKYAYIEAKAIIQPKLPGLDPGTQADLILFDRQAKQLDQSISLLLATPGSDVTRAVHDIITLGATAARLSGLALL